MIQLIKYSFRSTSLTLTWTTREKPSLIENLLQLKRHFVFFLFKMKRNQYQVELKTLFHYVCNAQTFVYSGFKQK